MAIDTHIHNSAIQVPVKFIFGTSVPWPIRDCVLFCCFVNLVTMATETHIRNSAICGPLNCT